ncbi:MAG: hypothetical protein ACKOFW_05750 [Planctomycetaceae bacterium]
MSEVRLVVCEAAFPEGLAESQASGVPQGLQWSGIVHGGTADRVIAGLSSDPETLEELEIAAARFERPRRGDRLELGLSPGLINRSHDAGLVVIDLGAKLVVINSWYSDPQPQGEARYHNGQFLTGIRLPYHLDEDWLFISHNPRWTELAEARRRERALRPRHDLRALLYGEGLLRFLAERVWRHGLNAGRPLSGDGHPDDFSPDDFSQDDQQTHAGPADTGLLEAGPSAEGGADRTLPPGDSDGSGPGERATATGASTSDRSASFERIQRMFARVHAEWLLSPNELLGGQAPRGLLVRGRRHVGRDLHDRCDAWSLLQRSPPAVPRHAAAWQFGPPGNHELILHYDLVRSLLQSTWLARLAWLEDNAGPPSAEVLDAEVARLALFRETWLDSPHDDLGDRVPRHLIERERSRLPVELSANELTCEPNCPCCQMLAELPGPSFWFLDSSHFDEEFAFSLVHETRRDYEEDPYLRPDDEYQNSRWNTPGDSADQEPEDDDEDDDWDETPGQTLGQILGEIPGSTPPDNATSDNSTGHNLAGHNLTKSHPVEAADARPVDRPPGNHHASPNPSANSAVSNPGVGSAGRKRPVRNALASLAAEPFAVDPEAAAPGRRPGEVAVEEVSLREEAVPSPSGRGAGVGVPGAGWEGRVLSWVGKGLAGSTGGEPVEQPPGPVATAAVPPKVVTEPVRPGGVSSALPDLDLPVPVRMLALACQVNNLLDALRGTDWREQPPPEIAERMARLTHHFGNLREVVLGNPQLGPQGSLVEPVAERLAQVVRELPGLRPNLSRACGMFERGLEALVDRLTSQGPTSTEPPGGQSPPGSTSS